MAIFDDLLAEQERIEEILGGLTDAEWCSPSAAAGWSIADVVLHLAQTEEAVAASVTGADLAAGVRAQAGTLDDFMDELVRAERADPAAIFQRWRAARLASVAALRSADPDRPLSWVAAPLKPETLATTRLAEHWAHGLDIAVPLGIAFPDTVRLRHIAWLAHRSLPYALGLAGEPPHDVLCELTAPDGTTTWRYGSAPGESPPRANAAVTRSEIVITGDAGEFCRVAARRLAPEESGLQATGERGAAVLRALRTYAA